MPSAGVPGRTSDDVVLEPAARAAHPGQEFPCVPAELVGAYERINPAEAAAWVASGVGSYASCWKSGAWRD